MADGLLYARLDQLGSVGLDSGRTLEALGRALHELATVEALVLIHGHARGTEEYFRRGGTMRFDAGNNPWVLVTLGSEGAHRRGVARAELHDGRPWWWMLDLECGHRTQRDARYRPLTRTELLAGGPGYRRVHTAADVLPAPKHVRCEYCLTPVKPLS